jgi:hypothetical protein
MRAALGACVMCVAPALLGCTASESSLPRVTLATQVGTVPLYAPAQGTGPETASPPRQQSALTGRASDRDGDYAGNAIVLTTDGGVCTPPPPPVSGFVVRGRSVDFGRFHGTIQPDNGLQMAYGGDWIVGQFQGALFRGQLSVPGPHLRPGCTYFISLERIGP